MQREHAGVVGAGAFFGEEAGATDFAGEWMEVLQGFARAGFGGVLNGLDHGRCLIGCTGDLDFHLGHHVGCIFSPAVNFGLTLLPAKAFNLSHSHTRHTKRGERLAYRVQLVRFKNGYNIFHAHPHLVCAVQYANAVPENAKDAKQGVLRILRRECARDAHINCLLFNQ